MVNTLSHIGIGLLLSYALGIKGSRRLVLVLLSLLPDLDYFSYSIFTLISSNVSHEVRNQLFYLMGHREFTHSVVFAFLVAFLIWIKTKDRLFTFGGFQAIFLHVLIDYTTSSKMRPFYPFSTNESALRAVYPYDPVINIPPLFPIFIVAVDYLKNMDFWNTKSEDIWNRKLKGLNRLLRFSYRKEKKLYTSVILVLLIWITVFPITKIFLINRISDAEGTRISYKNTYPVSPGKFLAAYSYNDAHFKLLELSYWSGIEKSFYVDKISVTGNIPDASAYAEKAGKLYCASVPKTIDYPVYSVSEENGLITVILTDARKPYVDKWPYFDTVYRFVFNRTSGEYVAYESRYERAEKKLDMNYFE
jgi:inner membrane protein